MSKPRYKTTNWEKYNRALFNRGSLTFWIDATGLKVYGEGEWKVKKHGTDRKRRITEVSDDGAYDTRNCHDAI
ncbi:transposase [Vibrio crassostreae]|nr:transposase [Vibrio crassostreae]CAK2276039.1 transposase [Vibrio crassostreae]CAK2412968.1 transposase [Vibrio crassostreae]CAK2645583.1 transposase [Vibrio crassostreae]